MALAEDPPGPRLAVRGVVVRGGRVRKRVDRPIALVRFLPLVVLLLLLLLAIAGGGVLLAEGLGDAVLVQVQLDSVVGGILGLLGCCCCCCGGGLALLRLGLLLVALGESVRPGGAEALLLASGAGAGLVGVAHGGGGGVPLVAHGLGALAAARDARTALGGARPGVLELLAGIVPSVVPGAVAPVKSGAHAAGLKVGEGLELRVAKVLRVERDLRVDLGAGRVRGGGLRLAVLDLDLEEGIRPGLVARGGLLRPVDEGSGGLAARGDRGRHRRPHGELVLGAACIVPDALLGSRGDGTKPRRLHHGLHQGIP